VPRVGLRVILQMVGRRRGVAWWLAIVGCRASAAPATDTGDTSSTSIGSTTTESSGSGTSESTDGSTSAAIVDGPPVVVDLGKSATYLGEGERLTITAFVQHPRGDAAVVEGALLGPGDPADYGAFVRGVNGRWSVEVGWDDVGSHIDLTFDDELVAEFVARFVDDAGLEGELAIGVRLRCIPLAPHACHGVCADFSVASNHCGECDVACTTQWPSIGLPVGGCDNGTCGPVWSACVDALEHVDCASACGSFGTTCVESGCAGYTIMPLADDSGCATDELPGGFPDPDECTSAFAAPFARCCCAA
jgi:hypothetical protein